MGRTISCRCSYPVFALLFLIVATAEAQQHQFHFHLTQQRRPNHNRAFYTQHTVFANPLLYHQHQTSPSPSGFFHPPDFYHHFNGLIGGGDYGRVPFDGPLFIPADGLETAETTNQVENYNKALQEILEEQLGATGGANDSNRGPSSGAGDQLNFNTDVLGGGTSFVRVRQSFGDKNSNYGYQYAL